MNLFGNKLKNDFRVIGVAGTHGKTSTTCMIHHFLRSAGHKTGFLNSYGYGTDLSELNKSISSDNLDKSKLKRVMYKLSNQGIEFMIIEMPADKLLSNVFEKISLDLGIVTNSIEDGIASVVGWQNFLESKLKFSKLLKDKSVLLLNYKSTPLISWLNEKEHEIQNNVYAQIVNAEAAQPKYSFIDGTKFMINDVDFSHTSSGYGEFENTMFAINAVANLIDSSEISKYLKSYTSPPGRFEIVTHTPFLSIVDYAKTKFQLENSLNFINQHRAKEGKLISLISTESLEEGSHKGAIATSKSDIVLIAASNAEDVELEKLNQELVRGAKMAGGEVILEVKKTDEIDMLSSEKLRAALNSFRSRGVKPIIVFNAPNYSSRLDAIKIASKIADSTDVFYLADKGNEDSINISGVTYEWSDSAAIKMLVN